MNRELSRIAQQIPPSGIRKFFDIVTTMKDAISLGVGEPDFDTPWHIREEGIYSLEKGRTFYTSNAGLVELREEICNYQERRFGLKYEGNTECIVTVGGSEGIDIALRAILNPGDEVLVPEPSFVCYKPIVSLATGIAIPIPLQAKNEFRLTREELEERVTDKTKALIISFPTNPTGAIMGVEDLQPIVDFCIEKDLIVISDEIYAELTYGQKHVSIASFDGMRERTILVSGFSKAYAMTGWRIGYVLAPTYFTNVMNKVHQYAIMCTPTTSQYAALEAAKNGDKDIEMMKEAYDQRRKFLVESFRRIGLPCFEPKGAFYIFPSVQETGLTSDEFATRLLLEQKVAVVPGTAFGDCGEGFVRISYAASIDEIKEAVARIEKFLISIK
ncbi:MAG: aminotransferase class I/II-fold pyridoxal phosphate-dependent enzyme [Vallitaleaceae bacterium]|nr:aminotransferase class I/II-fold pyridoxal phosphate-dependent enzyme [Vallitaleaceae bacterium]